jgi:DNA ligase-1
MIRAKPWNGKDLKGTWEVTIKIDGVRALWQPFSQIHGGQWVSRNGKPLYNLPQWRPGMPTDCEVYLGPEYGDQKARFAATIRAVRSQTLKNEGCSLKRCKCGGPNQAEANGCKNWELATPVIHPDHLYSLDPLLDERLRGAPFGRNFHATDPAARKVTLYDNPTAGAVRAIMLDAVEAGYEGLVLRQGDVWLKVKPTETYDVRILDVIEGVGKRKGHVGFFQTAKGKVGGFKGVSYEDLNRLWKQHTRDGTPSHVAGVSPGPLIGQTIEVECLHLTPDGKFRLPRFVRFRPDKDADE